MRTHFRYNSKSLSRAFPIYERVDLPYISNRLISPRRSNPNKYYTYQINNKNSTIKIVTNRNDTNVISNYPTAEPKTPYYKIQTKTAQPFFSRPSRNPVSDSQNNWFELKLKPPSKNNQKNTLPFITFNPYTNGLPNNNYFLGNTVTLSPEVVSISQGTYTLAGPGDDPCKDAIFITNHLFNKQACPDLDITINNHLSTESNIFLDEEDALVGDFSEDYVDEEIITQEESFVPEEEPVVAEGPIEEEPVEAAPADVLGGPPSQAAEPVVADLAGGSGGSAGSGGSGGGPGSGIGFPTLPSLSNSDDDESDGGIFGSDGLFSWVSVLNPFNFPLISLLAAPLTILFTSALGLSTFFLPWTVFPSIFLQRNARNNPPLSKPSDYHPDGWFWHKDYKTWVNMNKPPKRTDDSWGATIVRWIEEFSRKYKSKSWKRRRKSLRK